MIIGQCGICGGPVDLPSAWHGTSPPRPQCRSCDAYAKNKYGSVLEMDNAKDTRDREVGAGVVDAQRGEPETLGRAASGTAAQSAGASNKGKSGEKK